MQTYWASQSPVTDPGPGAAIDALPGDPAVLHEASSRLVFHFQAGGDFAETGVPAGRMAEINTRYADAMFALLMDRGEPALRRDRPAADRLVGCCRDGALPRAGQAQGDSGHGHGSGSPPISSSAG